MKVVIELDISKPTDWKVFNYIRKEFETIPSPQAQTVEGFKGFEEIQRRFAKKPAVLPTDLKPVPPKKTAKKTVPVVKEDPPTAKKVVEVPATVIPGADKMAKRHEIVEEVKRVASELVEAIEKKPTMSLKERASVAAKARWAREKELQKQGLSPAARKKLKEMEKDFNGARKVDPKKLKRIQQEFEISTEARAEEYVPDGRELIDGSWEKKQGSGDQMLDDMKRLRGDG